MPVQIVRANRSCSGASVFRFSKLVEIDASKKCGLNYPIGFAFLGAIQQSQQAIGEIVGHGEDSLAMAIGETIRLNDRNNVGYGLALEFVQL